MEDLRSRVLLVLTETGPANGFSDRGAIPAREHPRYLGASIEHVDAAIFQPAMVRDTSSGLDRCRSLGADICSTRRSCLKGLTPPREVPGYGCINDGVVESADTVGYNLLTARPCGFDPDHRQPTPASLFDRGASHSLPVYDFLNAHKGLRR